MRPLTRWSGAMLMVLLATAAYEAARVAPSGSAPPTVASTVPPTIPRQTPNAPTSFIAHAMAPGDAARLPSLPIGRPLRAAVLLQAVDCASNLRMLHLLHRPAVRNGIQLSVVWFVGPAGDSLVIRPLLPSWTATVPLRQAPRTLLHDLARLGHTSTPALVVLDQAGRVRFTSQSPRSSREYAGLRRIIEGLTWIEEL